METIGQRVIALRKRLGLTQTELGTKIGLAATTISGIEKDKSHPVETLTAIAKFFKVSEAWLINGEGEAPKGVVVPIRKTLAENPWKDALVEQLRSDLVKADEQIQFLREMLRAFSNKKEMQNFLKALSQAGTTGKLVKMFTEGVRLGARA